MKTEKEVMQMLKNKIREAVIDEEAGFNDSSTIRAHIEALRQVLNLSYDEMADIIREVRLSVYKRMEERRQK